VAAPAPGPTAAPSPQPPTATQAFFAADVHQQLEKNRGVGLDDPANTGELEAAFKPRPGRAVAVGLIGLIVVLAASYAGYWWWAQRGAATPAPTAPAASDVAAPPDAEATAPVEQNPAPVE